MLNLGLVLFVVGLAVLVFFNGYRETPPTPPFKINKMFLGRYTKSGGKIKLLDGGNRFFFLYPWVQKPASFDLSDKNFPEVQVDEVRTPDAVDLDFFYEVTWFVNPGFVEEFLETSGATKSIEQTHFDKVQKILAGIIAETIREYASDKSEGPLTWQEAVAMKPEAAEKIIRRICEREDGNALTPEDISRVRAGNGSSKMVAKGLGISVKRLNVTKVVPDESIELAAEEAERERRQVTAEGIERDFVSESIAKIARETGLTPAQAADVFQSERKKASRQILTLDERSSGGGSQGNQKVIVVPLSPPPTKGGE